MQKLLFVFVMLMGAFGFSSVDAQIAPTNSGIFFQAVARDNYSNPAKDRTVYVEASIIQNAANGTKVLTELFQTTTDGLGVFSISIGSGTRIGGTLSGLDKVDWANGPYFLGLKIAIKPLSPVTNWDYTKELIDLGASAFGTVPYAFYSAGTASVKDQVKTTDTAAMLLPYAKKTDLALKVNLADSSTIYVTPTQLRAVKFDTTSIYASLIQKEILANKSTSVTTDATSDVKYPSVRAVKSYVDLQFSNFVLADGSVTTSKLANGAVTDAKIVSVAGAKVTGDIAGNAATATLAANATKLATPRTINGVAFDGTSNITIATGSTVSDADATTKGVVQLAGDLTGTAAQPRIANGAVTDAKIVSVAGAKVTGDIAGNAATASLAANATKLATPRTINGVAFDGTSNITIATGSTVSDADATTKGVVQLAGDLTGTAAQPRIANGAVTDAKIVSVAGAKVTGDIAGNAATATLAANATNAVNATNATLAANATKLATPRTINGVAFDGTSNITIATGSNPIDADANTKGIVQLAGDLTGTAAQPRIANGAVTDAKIADVAASKITGAVSVANGGTGATTAAGARTNLGLVIGTDVLAQRTFGSAANNSTTDFIAATDKGANNGVATLGNDGKIPSTQIPAISFQSASVVANQAAMLALANQQVGSIAIRTDNNKNYVLSALPATTIANWVELATPSSVTSVNGSAGPNVVLTAADIAGVELASNKSNSVAADGTSTTKYPTVKSIKDYVDQQSANAGVADNSITSAKINGAIAIAKGGTGATTAADARTNLGLVIGTDVMSATATTTLTGDVTGSGNGSIATTVNSVGGVSSSTIATLPTSVNANTASITAEITRATNAEAALDTRVTSNTASITANTNNISSLTTSVNANTASITAEITRATNAEAALDTRITSNTASITAEITRATNAEAALDTRITSNTNSITANTADILLKAPINSPTFTGTPTAPTPATSDNSTKVATTEYVKNSITAASAGLSTIGAISATSNARGATISGTTELILTPADASNGGVVTTGAQTFAGAKTFTNTTIFGTDIKVNGMNLGRPGMPTYTENTAVGFGVLASYAPTSWQYTYNTGVGNNALRSLTNGGNNTAVGNNALYYALTSRFNTAVGADALVNSTESNNVGIGASSGVRLTTGRDNVMVGHLSGFGMTTGSNNTVVGSQTYSQTSGAIQIGLGITTGSNNTIIGSKIFGLAPTLSNNIILADGAGNIRAQHNGTTGWTLGTIVSGTWSGTAIGSNVGGAGSVNGLMKANGSGVVSAAVAGTDYLTPSGNAATATALATGRTISTTGDISFTSGAFDGTADVTGTATLTNTTVTAGTYGSSTAIPTFTVDSKGRLTAAGTVGITAGVSSLTYSSTSATNGGTISGTTLTLAAADATNPGLISTGTQTIAGDKTFNNQVSVPSIVLNNGSAIWQLGAGVGSTGISLLQGGCCGRLMMDDNGRLAIGANYAPTTFQFDVQGNGRFTQDLTAPNFLGNATTATTAGNITATTNTTLTSLSNLNTVGTITSGTWSGTTIAVANGGTGATTKIAAFDALSPMTTSGDLIYGGTSGTGTRLAKGTDGQILTLASGVPTWSSAGASGISSIGAISATSNANGATISGTTELILTPADATNGGILTTGVQTIAGVKTFSPTVTATANFEVLSGLDITPTFNNSTFTGVGNYGLRVQGVGIGRGGGNKLENTALGNSALYSNVAGVKNTGVGFEALKVNNSGHNNTALGYQAAFGGPGSTSGVTAIGSSVLVANQGSDNTAIGAFALTRNTTGINNTVVGSSALSFNRTGNNNVVMGHQALLASVMNSSDDNTAIGFKSMYNNTTGGQNSVLGYQTLFNNATGTNNVALGYTAGQYFGAGTSALTNSSQSIFVGSNVRAGTNSSTNEVVIGYGAIGNGSNTVTIGNSSTTANYFNGSINLTGNLNGGTWSGTTIGSNYGGAGSVIGLLKANGSGVVSAAVAGTDYQAPLTAGTSFIAPNAAITAATKTKITYDAFGLVTAGADATTADIAPSTNRNYVTDAQAGVISNTSGTNTGDQTITLTGDVTGTGTGSFAATLTNTTVTAAAYGSSTAIPTFTVDSKGRLTAASTASIVANAGTLTGTSLASTVTGSSLTGVATITSGTWNGSTIGVAFGGTGLTSPGTSGNILTSNGTSWVSSTPSGVNTISYTSATSYSTGGTISGTNLTLSAADATNPGLVSTGSQTFVGSKTFSATVSASSNIARGGNFVPTLTASENDDILAGIDINPTFINGNRQRVANYGIRVQGIGIGTGSGNINTNTTIGNQALFSNTTGSENTSIGSGALKNNDIGTNNTAIGFQAMQGKGNRSYNTAIGSYSQGGSSSTSINSNNTSVGYNSLNAVSAGDDNVAIGKSALYGLTTANYNTALGSGAGGGSGATLKTSGDYGIFIGYNAIAFASNTSNEIVIGSAPSQGASNIGLGSNSTSIGNTSTQQSRIYGALTVTPNTATGAGNSSTIAAQNAGGTNTAGGALNLTAGNAGTSGQGGNIVLTPGTSTTAANNGIVRVNGQVQITGGNPGAGEVLMSDANGLATWSYSIGSTVVTSTTTYAITLAEAYVFYTGTAAGAFTIPAAAAGNAGKEITIKNKTAFGITITPALGTIFIDSANTGAANVAIGIEASNNWVKLVSDGTQWNVIRALF